MRIIPMGTRLYVTLDPVAEKMVGSLHIPALHSELTRIGTVQAIGGDVTQYAVGDKVLVTYNVGRAISTVVDGFTPANDIHRIVCEEEILAKIEE